MWVWTSSTSDQQWRQQSLFHSFQRFVASIVKSQTPIVPLLLTFYHVNHHMKFKWGIKKSSRDSTTLSEPFFPSRVKGRRVEQDFEPMQEQQGAAWICLSRLSCCVSRAEFKCALKLKYQMSRVIPSNFHINQLHFDALHNIALYPELTRERTHFLFLTRCVIELASDRRGTQKNNNRETIFAFVHGYRQSMNENEGKKSFSFHFTPFG